MTRWVLVGAYVVATGAQAQSAPPAHYKAADLFEMAGRAVAAGDTASAETIYRALEHDPDRDIRCEARFRHARLLEAGKAWTAAALLLRAILDEQPKAQPARLELAKVLAAMGHESEARRQLRAAQAGGLPPQVAQAVNQFAAALRAARPFGGSFELGLSPSNNINRATTSPTLNSVLGPLDLSRDAQARSGIGLDLGGQGYVQVPLNPNVALTARLSTQNLLYRDSEFNDSTFAADAGAALSLGASRLRVSLGPAYRLYGAHPFTIAVNATADWLHPLGKRAQIDLESDFSKVTYKTNALQDGDVYGETASVERAFSARTGARLSLFVQRTTAADPGYALITGGVAVLAWHEWGKTTVYATGSVSHLESDARLFLYTDRRIEWLTRAGLGATFRQIQVMGFSPLVRVSYERNASTVGIYAYHRFAGDIAITRAF
jgi:Tfp pilus assembly protein PilF